MSEERDGLAVLKETIEEVTVEIESRKQPSSFPRKSSALLAAAALLIAVLLGYQILRKPQSAEVEVLDLRIEGRPVRARIVEGAAPSTIIIMPDRNGHVVAASAAGILGGTK
jgi:hypothetical protein